MNTITAIAVNEFENAQKVLVDVTAPEGVHHWHGNTLLGLRGADLQAYLDANLDQWYADIQVRCQQQGVELVNTHTRQLGEAGMVML